MNAKRYSHFPSLHRSLRSAESTHYFRQFAKTVDRRNLECSCSLCCCLYGTEWLNDSKMLSVDRRKVPLRFECVSKPFKSHRVSIDFQSCRTLLWTGAKLWTVKKCPFSLHPFSGGHLWRKTACYIEFLLISSVKLMMELRAVSLKLKYIWHTQCFSADGTSVKKTKKFLKCNENDPIQLS